MKERGITRQLVVNGDIFKDSATMVLGQTLVELHFKCIYARCSATEINFTVHNQH